MSPTRNQIKAADAGALNLRGRETIANGQGVLRVDLVIKARVNAEATLPRTKYCCEWIDDLQRLRIEGDRIDNRAVVDFVAPHIKEKRRVFAERTAHAAAIFFQKEWGLLLCVRIARIPELIGKVEIDRAFEFVSSRLGENLDASKAEFVVFRSERILIDANLANGFL